MILLTNMMVYQGSIDLLPNISEKLERKPVSSQYDIYIYKYILLHIAALDFCFFLPFFLHFLHTTKRSSFHHLKPACCTSFFPFHQTSPLPSPTSQALKLRVGRTKRVTKPNLIAMASNLLAMASNLGCTKRVTKEPRHLANSQWAWPLQTSSGEGAQLSVQIRGLRLTEVNCTRFLEETGSA